MLARLRASIITLAVFTALLGGVYPLVVTGLANVLFPAKAKGSLLRGENGVIASPLIARDFGGAGYFTPRPSGTAPLPYDGGAGAGTNLAPSNPEVVARARTAILHLEELAGGSAAPKTAVPIDLITASASGLDPHISPAAARFQAERVARARGRPPAEVRSIVDGLIETRTFGILGEPRVNTVLLNRELDRRFGGPLR